MQSQQRLFRSAAVSEERFHLVVVAVEMELKGVTVALKDKAHVQRIAALDELADYAQPNPCMAVWVPVGRIGGADCLQNG